LAELEEMDLGDDMKEGIYEEDKDMVFELDMEDEDMEDLDEHDLNLELDFDEDGLNISGNADGNEFDFMSNDESEDEMDDFEDESEGEEGMDDFEDESDEEFEIEDEEKAEASPLKKEGKFSIKEGLSQNGLTKIKNLCDKIGCRETAVKLIDIALSPISSSDLGDTVIFADGLDTIEELLESGEYEEAFKHAKEVAEEMLEDEGFGEMFENEEPQNEAKVRTFAHKRTQAGKLGSSKSDQKFLRPAVRQESVYKKDIDKLIKENNDLKSINLEFKDALKKYKTQLYEMAVFNANLSHVNNLFVEHTTTVDEKKQILNKFKSVATIEESKSVYNKFVSTLNESKKTKKTIEERVEKPSVGGDSGSQRLNESLSTQNEPDSVKAIKKMMKYIETKRK